MNDGNKNAAFPLHIQTVKENLPGGGHQTTSHVNEGMTLRQWLVGQLLVGAAVVPHSEWPNQVNHAIEMAEDIIRRTE